ncbi:MAG: sulfite exporter TauE/SafE family protein [Gordonia sp. (in: high G+C Gram-positive bacteria)]
MSVAALVALVVAGFAAGLVGYITGLASVVSYPALLAAGLPPIAANVTNTVSLIGVGVGSFSQSGRALLTGGRRRLAAAVVVSLLGGAAGALTLLCTPPDSFEVIVPYLVGSSAIALLVQPWLRQLASRHADRPGIWYVGLCLVSVYGGYFGAGAGIVLLALVLVVTSEPMWRATLLKSFLLAVANLVAALTFMISGPVHWPAAAAMGAGCLVGGWCGPPVVRYLPPEPLRIAVGIGGLGLAFWLAFN